MEANSFHYGSMLRQRLGETKSTGLEVYTKYLEEIYSDDIMSHDEDDYEDGEENLSNEKTLMNIENSDEPHTFQPIPRNTNVQSAEETETVNLTSARDTDQSSLHTEKTAPESLAPQIPWAIEHKYVQLQSQGHVTNIIIRFPDVLPSLYLQHINFATKAAIETSIFSALLTLQGDNRSMISPRDLGVSQGERSKKFIASESHKRLLTDSSLTSGTSADILTPKDILHGVFVLCVIGVMLIWLAQVRFCRCPKRISADRSTEPDLSTPHSETNV